MSDSSRRDFFRKSLALGSAAALAGPLRPLLARAGDKNSPKIRLGLCTYQWGQDWDLPTLLANCEKAGLLGVELRTQHKHGVEPSLTARQRAEVKKRFADSPVALVGLGSNENFDSPDPAVLRRSIETVKEFLKLSCDCGSGGVKVKPNSFHQGVPREKTIEQIGKTLEGLAPFAADLGQQLRLEVHGTCCELPTMKQIIDLVPNRNVALCWNSNLQDLQGAGLEHNFNLVKDRLGATLHVRELDSKQYPFQKLLDLLVSADYAGWVLLECQIKSVAKSADRIAALAEQRALFDLMSAAAKKTS